MTESAKRQAYPSDLTDEQWALLKPLLERDGGPGAPVTVDLREVVNTLLYMLRTGVQWRYLPHDLMQGSIVRYYKKKWREDGTWEHINDTLRQEVRQKEGRNSEPSAGIIDSQSVKTTESGGERGYDGGKQVKGRKRHILVDTLGLLLKVIVHSANIGEREGAEWLLAEMKEKFPRLTKIFADQGYQGEEFEQRIKEVFKREMEIVRREPGQKGFVLLVKRWIVERSLAWYSRCRRLSKDYEASAESSEAWIYLASIHLMLKRLAPDKNAPKPYAASTKLASLAA